MNEQRRGQGWWMHIVMAVWLALAACSVCRGATDSDELGGAIGTYAAEDAAPDNLTTTDGTKVLTVTDGSAATDRAFDQGKVKLTSKSGATAVFSGRSTGWGCTYTVIGMYGGGIKSKEARRGKTWDNQFEEEGDPRIALEINNPGSGDDVVLYGNDGGILRIWVFGTTGTVAVGLADAPDSRLSNLPESVNVTAGDTPGEVTLNGAQVGQVTITATATVNNESIDESIVASVSAFRGTITPTYNFTGRSLAKLGVGETGTLGVELAPGSTLAHHTPLTWATTSGATLTIANPNTDTGTATFTAGDVYGEVTLTLTDRYGHSETCIITVVSPVAVAMRREPGSSVFHIQGKCSVGFYGRGYLLPSDVSFQAIQIQEHVCYATATGFMAEDAGKYHPPGDWIGVTTETVATGTNKLSAVDAIISAVYDGPFDATGTFTWPIPWYYRVGTGTPHLGFITTSSVVGNAVGDATISKGGHPESREVNDDTCTTSW